MGVLSTGTGGFGFGPTQQKSKLLFFSFFFNLPNALVPGGLSMPALVKQNIFSAVHSPSYQPK